MSSKITKASSRVKFAEIENGISEFWKQNKIFEKSIENRAKAPKYSFVDGPPFVTGNPHYGSLLPSIAKDIIPRYQTMKGKQVRRVFGWDCHGLPIEQIVSDKLGLKTRDQIVEFGVDKYIQECRKHVLECIDNWQWYIDKIVRWVDTDNAYYTMNPEFNESVLWLFKQAWDKNLIYKGKRVSLFSTDNSTPVSEFEVNMDSSNFREIKDTSVFIKFPLVAQFAGFDNVEIIAWTTTPWTLPAHSAIAVNLTIRYCLVEFENQKYLVGKNLLAQVFATTTENIGTENGKLVQILKEFVGADLIGLKYSPPFNFNNQEANDKNFRIYPGDFVTESDGTAFVHLAVYGREDYDLFQKYNIPAFESIDEAGNMLKGPFKGRYLREATDPIIEDLQSNKRLFRTETIKHRLPHYRGPNPLIYFPQDSYFINIQSLKPRMLELNKQINWYPKHLQQGRFLDVIENSPDWCISRNRFWATIMPLWIAIDGEQIVIGSIAEMAEYNSKITQKLDEKGIETWFYESQKLFLHRDVCDQIILIKDGKEFKRVSEVLDCWMDSGSVPFAEHHYPFENKEEFEAAYPADYIIEYVGQLRAWFNVLLRVAVIGFDSAPFRNAVTTGNIAGNDGRKMSKSFGNYSDPKETLLNLGGEALRLYLMGSPVMNGEDMNWSDETLNDQIKNILIPFWNIYVYLTTYAEMVEFDPGEYHRQNNALDIWLENRIQKAINEYTLALDSYDLPASVKLIQPLIDDVSTWWIRRSRDRFAAKNIQAISVLYFNFLKIIKLLAPQIPFLTEQMYQNVVVPFGGLESIHLEDYPKTGAYSLEIQEKMSLVRELCSLGLNIRAENNINLRQPLTKVTTNLKDLNLQEILKEELNVKEVVFQSSSQGLSNLKMSGEYFVHLDIEITDQLLVEGQFNNLIRHIQNARKKGGLQMGQIVKAQIFCKENDTISFVKQFETEIKKQATITEIEYADFEIENSQIFKHEGIEVKIRFE